MISLVKPLSKEWEDCRLNLQKYSDRVQRLAQATEANIRESRDQEKASVKEGKHDFGELRILVNGLTSEKKKSCDRLDQGRRK